MKDKKYKKSDLRVEVYGHGLHKKFIMYTDYDEEIWRWNTRVYPDIEGNAQKAVTQAIKWLNRTDVPEPYIVKNSPTKVTLSYGGYGSPDLFFETDERGKLL